MLEKEPYYRISSSVVVKRLTSLKVRHKKPSQKRFLNYFYALTSLFPFIIHNRCFRY